MPTPRREFLVHASAVGAACVLPSIGAHASTSLGAPNIVCSIQGQSIDRDAVLLWEHERMTAVWRKLRPYAPSAPPSKLDRPMRTPAAPPSDMQQLRQDLLALKLQMGPAKIRNILSPELAASEAVLKLLLGASFGRFAVSVTDIACDRGSAEGFVAWFAKRLPLNDEPTMLAACPDHYVIETDANGHQFVLETTGGSPLPSQFDIDYQNQAGTPIPNVPAFPVRVGGMALRGGRTIGYAIHQFGPRPEGGFAGRLSVAFPRATPWFMIDGHRWHLACEFSNWVEAYLRDGG